MMTKEQVEVALKIAETYIYAARVADEMKANRSIGSDLGRRADILFNQGTAILENTREAVEELT